LHEHQIARLERNRFGKLVFRLAEPAQGRTVAVELFADVARGIQDTGPRKAIMAQAGAVWSRRG
jgi:hypothetical protein